MKSVDSRRSRRRAVGYVRVSVTSRAKQQVSLAQQQQGIAEFCAINEIDLIDVYVEAGESAKSGLRPALQRMTADATAMHQPIDLILVGEISRLFRDAAALSRYRRRLAAVGVDLMSVRRQAFNQMDGISMACSAGK